MIYRKQLTWLGVIMTVTTLLTSCTKTLQNAGPDQITGTKSMAARLTAGSSSLITYKNSPHHIFVGFLVGDGADSPDAYNPTNSPDSVDFLEFFAGNDPNRADWRAAQAKGTRIVVCHFLSDAWFDGSSKDPATPNSTATIPNSGSTYDHWAQAMYNKHIVADSLDGIDLDIESGTIGGQVSAASVPNLLASVAKYFGPNSTSAPTLSMGKKAVFFYDTDGSADNNTYIGTKSNYDYVLFQAYVNGNHYWSGSGTQDFGPLISGYGADKLIYLVNGDDFSTSMTDAPTVSLLSYAQWVVQNNGIGVGAYRMSRDYLHTPHFAASRQAIQIMNPANAGGGIVSGGTYKIISAVNNSSLLDVTGGGTTDGTLVELWSNNTPTSTNQEWVLTSLGSGYYKLQPANAAAMAMDVSNSGTADGTQVQIYTSNNTNAQKWLISPVANGYYTLSPACAPGSRLDVNAQGTANGTKIQIWTANNTVAQNWKLVQQ